MRFIKILCLFLVVPIFAEEKAKVPNHISLLAELVYLRRTKVTDRCFAEVDPSATSCGLAEDCKLDSKGLVHAMTFQPGLRASLTIMPDQDYSIEAGFLGFFHWKGKKSAVCNNGLNFPFRPNNTIDYKLASMAEGLYLTDLTTAEFNYWRHVTPQRANYFSVSWVAGLRYVNIDEYFKVTFFKGPRASDYKVWTSNQAGGIQIGGDFEANPYRVLTWGMIAKMGFLANWAEQRSKLRDNNDDLFLRDFHTKGWDFAFLGEAAPFLILYFHPQMFLRLSYEVLFLANVALAPSQTGLVDSGSGLNHHGNVLYHGAFGGLGIQF